MLTLTDPNGNSYLKFKNEYTCLMTLIFLAFGATCPLYVDLNALECDFDGSHFTIQKEG